jgi:hypothetical protein
MEAQIRSELVSSLPRGFVGDLMRIVDWAYEESYNATFNDPLLDTPQREYNYPHYRRSILERRVHTVAQGYGLSASYKQNVTKNFRFTEILAGQFRITISHKTGKEWRMLRSCGYREQNANLNSMLAQLEFGLGEPTQPVEGGLLNAVIYHGTDLKDKNRAGYLRIGVPRPDNSYWAARFDFYELLQAYVPIIVASTEEEQLVVKWKSKFRELDT